MHIYFKAINKRKRIINTKMQDVDYPQEGKNEMLLGENAIIIKLRWHTQMFSILKHYIYIIESYIYTYIIHIYDKLRIIKIWKTACLL